MFFENVVGINISEILLHFRGVREASSHRKKAKIIIKNYMYCMSHPATFHKY